MMIALAVRKFLRWLGYDIVRVRVRNGAKTAFDNRSLPQIPKSEVLAVKKILSEYVARFGNQPGQYRTLKAAARYLDETRMRKQWGTVAFAHEHGLSFERCRILDVGSGTGYLLRTVKAFAPNTELVGFDPSPKSETLAPMLCPTAKFKLELVWESEGPFDVVFCTQVLEHLVDPDSLLHKLYGVLNPGGSLVLTVPDGRYNFLEAGRFSEKTGSYEGHVNFWSPESWRHWLEKNFSADCVITSVNDRIGNLAVVKKS
jgi:2-polyprenyl-3-methyl-5-hydroxy-6-metoxy-1,4-benzoquinol methylase